MKQPIVGEATADRLKARAFVAAVRDVSYLDENSGAV
jgi:hypothetical protein